MDRSAVASHLGPPVQSEINWQGRLNESRGTAMPTCSFSDRGLIGIGVSPDVGAVLLDGFDLFSLPCDRAIRHATERNNDQLRFGLGTFIFDELAMTAGDFWDAETKKWFEPTRGVSDPRGITIEAAPDPDWDIESFPPMKL